MSNPTTGYIVRNGNFPANTDLSNVFQAYTSTRASTTGFKLRTTGQDLNLIFEGLGAQTGTPDPSNTGYKLKTNGYDLVQIFKKIRYNWQQTNSGVTYSDYNIGSGLPSFTTAMSSDGSIQIQLFPYTNSYAYSNNSGNTFTTVTLTNQVTSCAVSGNGKYGLITTASEGITTSIYLSTTLSTSGNFKLLDNTIVPTGSLYTTCAVSSSGRYMCVFDFAAGYCYSADFGAHWSGTTLINTSSSDSWNTRYTVVFAAEGTGLTGTGQPMVYTSSNDATNPGDLRWYDSFFTAKPASPPTLKGKNPYGNGYANNSGFFSMCLNGNYIYASAGNQRLSNLLLQYNISENIWSTYTLPVFTKLFSLCNTSTGKVYFISSNSLGTSGGIENQIYYLTGNNITGNNINSVLTLYDNANFAALNAKQDVYSIGTSFTSGQYITCINHYTNGDQISVYSDGNSGNS
jgi:hypothetical protein